MNTEQTNPLFAEFREILRSGDEEKARAFLRDHFKEFPEEVQKKVVMAAFEDGMENRLRAEEEALDLKEGLLDLFKDESEAA